MNQENPSTFIQEDPDFPKLLSADTHLIELINDSFSDLSQRQLILNDLENFYSHIIPKAHAWAKDAEENPPTHIPYNNSGQRIDKIATSRGWKKLDELSASESLINLGYRNGHNRIHQFLKLYLFHPSSAFYTCPLAMTDGAAKLIDSLKGESSQYVQEILDDAFMHLTSSDPKEFWTSGQWMTEKTGGSDVAISQTVAIADASGESFNLFGTKWFTSATTSQVCFTLARIKEESQEKPSDKLSLFFVKLRDENNELQGISVRRLKNKLGTKALPTAEIDFNGAKAYLVGNKDKGIKNISHLFNITRIYNAVTSTASFRRILFLAEDYAMKRVAFGKKLSDHPLHKRMLNDAKSAFSGCFKLTFYTVSLLDELEKTKDAKLKQEKASLLRLLTPLAKLFTAKENMKWTSELLESFGGLGYIEDSGIPKFLRDAQVLCIWEGTTNILALDCLRAIQRDNSLGSYFASMQREIVNSEECCQEQKEASLERLKKYVEDLGDDPEKWEVSARELCFVLAKTTIEMIS